MQNEFCKQLQGVLFQHWGKYPTKNCKHPILYLEHLLHIRRQESTKQGALKQGLTARPPNLLGNLKSHNLTMTDTNKRQSTRLQEKWIEQFKPLIDKADHHLVDDYYACFSDDVWGALDHYLESKNNNNVSSPLVHLSSAVAQSNEPISSQPQSEDSMGTDTSDNQREALPDDVATSGLTDALVMHYFENNDSSNSSFAANNTTTSTNAQSNNWSPPTVAAASSKQPPSKSILSPRKRTADDAPPSSRPADTKKLFSREPSSSLLSPDGISGFITSTPAANPLQPIEDGQQSHLGIPTSASLPNVPSAQQTSKGLMSRRLYFPLDKLGDLPEYNGGNDELLRNLHGYDEDKAASELKKLLGEKGGAISFDQLKHVSSLASTTSINIDTNALGHGAMQRVVMTDDLREKMNKILDGLDIHYNESTPCVVDGCNTPACTSRKAEEPSPPNSIPFSHCMKHALQLSADTGVEFVYWPCRNEHGEERDVDSGGNLYTLCSVCLSNKECRIEGCKKGGNGNTHPKEGVCIDHYNQRARARMFMKKDVQYCRRCDESLVDHLVTSSSGAAVNICDRADCKNKCVWVVATSPDGEEEFCSNERVQGTQWQCYCTEHQEQEEKRQAQNKKEKRANGGSTKMWTERESDILMRAINNSQCSRKNKLFWKEVVKAVKKDFETNGLDQNKFTMEQMQRREKFVKKRKKNPKSVPVSNLPWYKCKWCIKEKGEEKTRAKQKPSANATKMGCDLKLDGCGRMGWIGSNWREVPPPSEN
jgi:hypothetical protein